MWLINLLYDNTYRGALEYDFRHFFSVPLSVVESGEMSLSEAVRLAEQLSGTLSSRFCAVWNGWQHPISPEYVVLADIAEALAGKTYPRYTDAVKVYHSDRTIAQFSDDWANAVNNAVFVSEQTLGGEGNG